MCVCAGIYRKRPLPHVVSDDDIALLRIIYIYIIHYILQYYTLSVFALYQYAARVHCIVFAPCKMLCKKTISN